MVPKRIKVAVVVDEYFGGVSTPFGGYGYLARNIICKHLPSKHIDVEVLLARKRKPWRFLPTKHRIDGISVIRPPSRLWLPFWLTLKSYDVYLTIELTHDVTAFDPRPWKRIVHWVRDPRPWYVWRKIQTMQLVAEPVFFSPRLNAIVTAAHKKGQLKFISQGASLNDYARDLYAIPDDVDIETVRTPVPAPPAFNAEKDDKENLVLLIGRLESQKRAWLFCEVARRLPQYQFVAIGTLFRNKEANSAPLAAFMAGAVPNLQFVGHQEGAARDAYLKRAKILLNTSIWEGIPSSFYQALAAGTLIVSDVNPEQLASRFGVYVGEYLGDGFEAIDPFVSAIDALLRDERRRSSLAQAAVEYVREWHSVAAFQRDMSRLLLKQAMVGADKRAMTLTRGRRAG